MQAVFFYLAYPFVFLVASLPFKLLYVASDCFYYILKLSGYRRKVVLNNLKNSFPEKSSSEIKEIADAYFRYLCDLTLETLKTMKMSDADVTKHCRVRHEPFLDKFYEEKKSIIIVMGHYGNWEWAGPAFSLAFPYELVVIYRPLANPYFEKMLSGWRTRHGTKITPVSQTLRAMVANRPRITATAFIADQTASRKDAYWTTFLNQDTAVFTGPEKLGKKFNYPIVFINTVRLKRGLYEVQFELMFSDPSKTAEGEISETFTKRLEQEIKKDPTIWLWSHKRWKHKRPVN